MPYENPEFVERMLEMRRQNQKVGDKKIGPPSREGMVGELKHPSIAGLVTGWIEITEAKATVWLDYNVHNRKLNKKKVAAFARQHTNDEFVATHQGIAFNDANELVDGQHTLKMVILTGKPVWRMVTFGLPKKPAGKNFTTMDVIDAGGRSVSDQLTVSHGVENPNLVKQICNALAHVCHGARARNLSVGEVLVIYHSFKEDIDWVIKMRSNDHGLKQAGVLAGFAFAHAALGEKVETWLYDLNTGRGLVGFDKYMELRKVCKVCRPLEHLRYFLTSDESALFSKAMNRAIAQVTLQALYGEQYKSTTQALEQSEVGAKWFCAKLREKVEKIAAIFVDNKFERKKAA